MKSLLWMTIRIVVKTGGPNGYLLEARVNETWSTEMKQSYREWGSNARPLCSGSERKAWLLRKQAMKVLEERRRERWKKQKQT